MLAKKTRYLNFPRLQGRHDSRQLAHYAPRNRRRSLSHRASKGLVTLTRNQDSACSKAIFSLVAVSIFLATHVAVVLHVAFGEIFSDIFVALNVRGS
jgi:hypothetical protein